VTFTTWFNELMVKTFAGKIPEIVKKLYDSLEL
jgi:hypothetical protein